MMSVLIILVVVGVVVSATEPKEPKAPSIKCKENEVYNPCRIICPPQTCESIHTSYDCQSVPNCEPGCDCIAEYLRNGTENDLCIPSHLCPTPPPVCGINEHYETNRNKCELTCKNYHLEPVMGPCQATSACFCDDGYVRNSTGLCIPKKKCLCGPNETLDPCPPACPPTDDCSNLWSKFNCTNGLKCCKPQCRCNSGNLRKNKVCVPTEQCSN